MGRVFITMGRNNDKIKEVRPKRKVKQLNELFRHEGFVLNGYDATWTKTAFDISEHDDVIEVEELNSGIRFVIFKKEGKK